MVKYYKVYFPLKMEREVNPLTLAVRPKILKLLSTYGTRYPTETSHADEFLGHALWTYYQTRTFVVE